MSFYSSDHEQNVKEQITIIAPKPSIAMSLEEDSCLEEWLLAEESTRHTITLPTSVAFEVADLTKNNGQNLNYPNTVELYRVLYSRVVKFASFIMEFRELTESGTVYLFLPASIRS
jgi:hypothetical protein